MDLVELSRRLENTIRIGTIFEVDHAAVRCRVQSGRLVSNWLRWLTLRAGETTTWDPPTVGEQCLILSPSGEAGNGIVLYGIDSNLIEPPSHEPALHKTLWPDGGFVQYDHDKSEYFLKVPADGRIIVNIGKTTLEMIDDQTTLTTPKFNVIALDWIDFDTKKHIVNAKLLIEFLTEIYTVRATSIIDFFTIKFTVNAVETFLKCAATVEKAFRYMLGMVGRGRAEITGDLTLNGQQTISESLQVGADINAGGSIIDASGNSNHHSHG